MNALVVGAGPVGRVLGYHLAQGGADVSFLVKPAHVAALRDGFSLRSLLGGRTRRFERPRLVTEAHDTDLVVVATDTTDLRDWPGRQVVIMQPVLEPIRGVTRGMFSMLALGAGAADPEPTRTLRLGRLAFSGPGADVIAGALARGGLPTRVVADVLPELVAASVILDPLAAAIAIAGKLPWLARDAALKDLAAQAGAECADAVGVRRPPRMVFGLAARAPSAIGRYLERHYGKLRGQTAAALDAWIARAPKADALRVLRDRLDGPAGTALAPRAARRLAAREPIAVDHAGMAMKRNVHEVVVGCSATAFAKALATVMGDPSRRYGPIVVKRPIERIGKPFEVGDRFTGCFTLWPGSGPAPAALRAIEDAFASDYAEIVARSETEVTYRYLRGSPIAGTSTYRIEPIDDHTCRFEARFEYQETGTVAVAVLHFFGHRQHDRVVAAQIRQAAILAGARVPRSTFHGSFSTEGR